MRTHVAYSTYRRTEQQSVGYCAPKADRLLGAAHQRHKCLFPVKHNYREIQRSDMEKRTCVYIHMHLYLSGYSELNQIFIQKRLEKPPLFSSPPTFVATFKNSLDFPSVKIQIFLEYWERIPQVFINLIILGSLKVNLVNIS